MDHRLFPAVGPGQGMSTSGVQPSLNPSAVNKNVEVSSAFFVNIVKWCSKLTGMMYVSDLLLRGFCIASSQWAQTAPKYVH